MNKFRSFFIVLSAPSGGGKTTIAKKLVNKHPDLVISVSATTRGKRRREKEGIDYFFLSNKKFEQLVKNNEFIEHEEVHGNYYGTLRSIVEKHISDGKTVVFDIDVKGALHIKEMYPKAILIFIKAPSMDVLRNRLVNRKSESREAIKRRLERLPLEYNMSDKFDYTIINHNLDNSVKEIEKIIIG